MKSSPVRHCDAAGEDVWCRFLPNWYQYTYIVGRMGARVWYWAALSDSAGQYRFWFQASTDRSTEQAPRSDRKGSGCFVAGKGNTSTVVWIKVTVIEYWVEGVLWHCFYLELEIGYETVTNVVLPIVEGQEAALFTSKPLRFSIGCYHHCARLRASEQQSRTGGSSPIR